ncbi:hypothetical protein [Tahibacter caeni]|uniref:hypothetical protein n=1 Tax=Tahibacter caeni TaxID=1453545 RepID=UPI0021486F28|nr:hypothetical protein [Tahibacter caeni]
MFDEGRKWFAPRIEWQEINVEHKKFPKQLRERFEGFYFVPAEQLLEKDNDFAAGVLILCALDAIARLWTGKPGQVGARFKEAAEAMGMSKGQAAQFYDGYRNGLIHEARIKSGACFDKSRGDLIGEVDGGVVANPRHLLRNARQLLDELLADSNHRFSKNALPLLRQDMAEE